MVSKFSTGARDPLLRVENLSVVFRKKNSTHRAVNGLSFSIQKGEIFGMVGETGCGKSLTGLSILRLVPSPGEIASGKIIFKGDDLLLKSEVEMRLIRGKQISMIFQDPSASLNPVFTVGEQIIGIILQHHPIRKSDARKRALELFKAVELPEPERLINAYPHELSGGMQQRVMIAMALSSEIELLIADEPTTALDVTIESQILKLLGKLQSERGLSVLLITHNIGVVAEQCRRVGILYAGNLVEIGLTTEVFQEMKHPYTQALFAAIPRPGSRGKPLQAIPGSVPGGEDIPGMCFSQAVSVRNGDLQDNGPQSSRNFDRTPRILLSGNQSDIRDAILTQISDENPLMEVRGLVKHFYQRSGLFGLQKLVIRALDAIDLKIMKGETVGLVGELGCGKSTLGRCLLRLIEPTAGEAFLEGQDLLKLSSNEMQQRRCDIQMLYQNPYSSLNPRLKVREIIAEPIITHTQLDKSSLSKRVEELLVLVDLQGDDMQRFPHEFSGGQLQRIALARTLSLRPKFVILDEPTSALDVSVQANILNLLQKLQAELELTYLFISHDLSVVQHISNRIAVMYLGRIVELASTEDLFTNALHPYTQALLSAIPTTVPNAIRERIVLEGNVASSTNPPPGCKFSPRCRARIEHGLTICTAQEPVLTDYTSARKVRCWLYSCENMSSFDPKKG